MSTSISRILRLTAAGLLSTVVLITSSSHWSDTGGEQVLPTGALPDSDKAETPTHRQCAVGQIDSIERDAHTARDRRSEMFVALHRRPEVAAALEEWLGHTTGSLGILELANDAGLLSVPAEILRLADLAMSNGLPARCALALEYAIATRILTPDAATYEKLGTCWLEAGKLEKAVARLERADELATTGAALLRLGELHLRRGDPSAAMAVLERALAKGGLTEPADAQFLIGTALFEQDRWVEARAWFEQARNAQAHRRMSGAYLREIEWRQRPIQER